MGDLDTRQWDRLEEQYADKIFGLFRDGSIAMNIPAPDSGWRSVSALWSGMEDESGPRARLERDPSFIFRSPA